MDPFSARCINARIEREIKDTHSRIRQNAGCTQNPHYGESGYDARGL